MTEQVKEIAGILKREGFYQKPHYVACTHETMAELILDLLSPKGDKPPVMSGQIRDTIEREYATPPIISGKCWEERATVRIVELLESRIQQAKEEVVREIKGALEKMATCYDVKDNFASMIWLHIMVNKVQWQAFWSKHLKG